MTENERDLFERTVVWLDMPQTGHPKRLIKDINEALADTEDTGVCYACGHGLSKSQIKRVSVQKTGELPEGE